MTSQWFRIALLNEKIARFTYLHNGRYKTVRDRVGVGVLRCENYHDILLVWSVLAPHGTEQLPTGIQHSEIRTVSPRDIRHPLNNQFHVDAIYILQSHDELGQVTVDDETKLNIRENLTDRFDQQ